MRVEQWNGRNCLFGFSPELSNTEILRLAYEKRLVREGRKYFVGSSRVFGFFQKDLVTIHAMRENWNGWNDLVGYSLPGWERAGSLVPACPSAGRHRDELVF